MIRVSDNNQVQLFTTPFEQELDLENRWVKFSNLLPWNKLSSFYYTRKSSGMGAGTTDARIVLVGAIIIKHQETLSDEGTIDAIKENIYMQYFLGLPSFKKKRTYKIIRKAVGQQLNYVNRNLKKIELLLTDYNAIDWIFTKHKLKYLQVIHEVYRQQKLMHSNQTHSTTNRIVSIHQPHARPMVRSKAGSDVEFGSKIGGMYPQWINISRSFKLG